ncbi:MAG TPA: hydantoinase B/oxoprolinase family protein [Rhodopila sp.]|nr:hydantoinase B/oxoprolinase family protein [Rhodopila sp.]
MRAEPALDAVTIEILWTRIVSIVDEAAKVIARTAFSTLSNEANDFACVLTDATGRSLAQNTYGIPSFIATLPATVRHMLEAFGAETMRPGDVYITNNPWQGTGHLPDVCLVKPIFHGGKLVAFSATTSHVPDIGGNVRSVAPRELFEEGLHIPLTRFMRDGIADPLLLRIITANVRTPAQTIGDIWAQISANEMMEQRLAGMLREYRLADLSALAEEIFQRSEAAMRRAIHALPDGTFRCHIESDGMEAPFHFHVALHVANREIVADYTGTSPQQPCAINCPLTYTNAMTFYALKCALLPELPNNDGMFRPVRVVAPERSLLNPVFPAAVGARAATGHYVPVVVFGALHAVIPDRVMAAPGSPLWNLTLTGDRGGSGGRFTSVLFFNGGLGGRPGRDGASCLSWPSNISATPVEVAERNAPVFFAHKRLSEGSGGDGQFRGGLGQDVRITVEAEHGTSAFLMVERVRIAAPGLGGGVAGAPGRVLINDEPANARVPHHLQAGDTITLTTPGGGGYGEPALRETAARQRDAALGYAAPVG